MDFYKNQLFYKKNANLLTRFCLRFNKPMIRELYMERQSKTSNLILFINFVILISSIVTVMINDEVGINLSSDIYESKGVTVETKRLLFKVKYIISVIIACISGILILTQVIQRIFKINVKEYNYLN